MLELQNSIRCNYFQQILAFIIAGLLTLSNLKAESLCEPNETTLFSCKLPSQNDVISFCEVISSENQAALQFKLGRAQHIQLIYPGSKAAKFSAAWQYTRDNGWGQSASFAELKFQYKSRDYSVTQTILGETSTITYDVKPKAKQDVNKLKRKSLHQTLSLQCEWQAGSLNEVAQRASQLSQ